VLRSDESVSFSSAAVGSQSYSQSPISTLSTPQSVSILQLTEDLIIEQIQRSPVTRPVSPYQPANALIRNLFVPPKGNFDDCCEIDVLS